MGFCPTCFGSWQVRNSLIQFAELALARDAKGVFVLFARFNRNGDIPPEQLFVLLGLVCAILLVQYTILIFFLLTLHRLLNKCRKRNRTMEPGLVWLNLIPCFQFVWQFITVVRIDETLREEFRERGIGRRNDSYGKSIGLASCIFWVVAKFFDTASNAADRMNQNGDDDLTPLAILTWILLVITLIFLVTYWIKMAGYSRLLSASESNFDDDYDDRPRRRPSRDDWNEDRDDRPRRRLRDDWDDDRDDRSGRRPRDEWDDDRR